METTLLSGPGRDWLVVGSNGAVGSELTQALLRSSYIDGSRPVDVRVHPHHSYAEASLDLVLSRSSSHPLRFVFCAGKGGFSLAQASAEAQFQAFDKFCRLLAPSVDLDKFVFVSSLGAHCSLLGAPYSQLIRSNEETVLAYFGERSLILRLPSLYGYHDRAQRYHGLIGVILRNLKTRCPTGIYARLETRRNYLSVRRLATLLVRDRPDGALLEANGCLNVQSSVNLSVFDVCGSFFRAVKQRPILKLMDHSLVDAEHHCPGVVYGARVIVNDPIGEWVSWQWNRSVHLSP
jgi:nucleoside-diphosphate-sugar epimerase